MAFVRIARTDTSLNHVLFLDLGMVIGAALVGVHMAMTHGVTIAMMASYIPTTEVPGIGKIAGTCWSFTDLVLGEPPAIECSVHVQSSQGCMLALLGLKKYGSFFHCTGILNARRNAQALLE